MGLANTKTEKNQKKTQFFYIQKGSILRWGLKFLEFSEFEAQNLLLNVLLKFFTDASIF